MWIVNVTRIRGRNFGQRRIRLFHSSKKGSVRVLPSKTPPNAGIIVVINKPPHAKLHSMHFLSLSLPPPTPSP
jgi:hypothetical protein